MKNALLEAIIANPADDLPRLIYCDWLEERGEAERAEFIRIQCELARLKEPCETTQGQIFLHEGRHDRHVEDKRQRCGLCKKEPVGMCRWHTLLRREKELLKNAGTDWQTWGVDGDDLRIEFPTFTRGFISKITCSAQDWLTHAEEITKSQPIEAVTLTSIDAEWKSGKGFRCQAKRAFRDHWPNIKLTLPITFEEIIRHKLQSLGRMKFSDLVKDWQDTVSLKRLMRDRRVKFETV